MAAKKATRFSIVPSTNTVKSSRSVLSSGERLGEALSTVGISDTNDDGGTSTAVGMADGIVDGRFDGILDGKELGSDDGVVDGSPLETPDGTALGKFDSTILGTLDGSVVGRSDGIVEGKPDGSVEDNSDGNWEGKPDGNWEGKPDGNWDGRPDGMSLGPVERVGGSDPSPVGRMDGNEDGSPGNDGCVDGWIDGKAVGALTVVGTRVTFRSIGSSGPWRCSTICFRMPSLSSDP